MVEVRRRDLLGGLAAAATAGKALAQPNPQANPMADGWAGLNRGRYLPAYAIAARSKPEDSYRDVFEQWAAFVGDQDLALSRAVPKPMAGPAPGLAGAVCRPAVDAIVEASRDRRIVFLNEAHVASRHRAFLAAVLPALKREGFTHLACETFNSLPDPGVPDIRKFAAGMSFDPGYGTYTWDPVFADAIRQARDLGYGFERYEQRPDQRDAKLTGLQATQQREDAEAANFIQALDANPDARFLVYVGYDHLRKTPDRRGGKWFAARLKEKTGIDPLCVAQAHAGSFAPHGPTSPTASAVIKRFSPKAPVVVAMPDGASLTASLSAADLAVFHPELPDRNGRPGWLAAQPGRVEATVAVPAAKDSAPRLLQAVYATDPDHAVPADHLLLAPGQISARLWLRPGRYRIRLETAAGHVPVDEIRI